MAEVRHLANRVHLCRQVSRPRGSKPTPKWRVIAATSPGSSGRDTRDLDRLSQPRPARPAQLFLMLDHEHGLEGRMAEVRINRLQDEPVRSNGHGPNPILWSADDKGECRCARSDTLKATLSWAIRRRSMPSSVRRLISMHVISDYDTSARGMTARPSPPSSRACIPSIRAV